jgi:hypothetical protein
MCLALSTRTRDFHPLDCAHAGRTKKQALAAILLPGPAFCQINSDFFPGLVKLFYCIFEHPDKATHNTHYFFPFFPYLITNFFSAGLYKALQAFHSFFSGNSYFFYIHPTYTSMISFPRRCRLYNMVPHIIFFAYNFGGNFVYR